MRVNRGLLGWGVFFIVLGAVPLAVQAGVLDPAAVRNAWQLWPLILIGIGLGLALARTRLAILGSLIVAVTFGLMGGALIATGVGWTGGFSSCGFGGADGGDPFPTRRGTFGGDARVRFEMDCGDLRASAVDGSDWVVAGTSDDGQAPEITARDRELAVRAPDRTGVELGADAWSWDVSLPREVAITIDLSVNAGSGHLDLAGMRVPAVDASVNAGEARVDLGNATGTERLDASVNAGSLTALLPVPEGTLRGSISVNAGSAELCIPDGVAVRVRAGDQALGSIDVGDRGLVESGDGWTSPGYGEAVARVDLELSANLGSITLDPEDGCD